MCEREVVLQIERLDFPKLKLCLTPWFDYYSERMFKKNKKIKFYDFFIYYRIIGCWVFRGSQKKIILFSEC